MPIKKHVCGKARAVDAEDTQRNDWARNSFLCFVGYFYNQIVTRSELSARFSAVVLENDILDCQSIFWIRAEEHSLFRETVEILIRYFLNVSITVYLAVLNPNSSLT